MLISKTLMAGGDDEAKRESINNRIRSLWRHINCPYKEFIAEAWSEYLNNPNPRPIVKTAGDIIVTTIKEDSDV